MTDYDPAKALVAGLTKVTARWKKQRLAEDRAASQRTYRLVRMTRVRRVTLKEAAEDVMEEAYLAASANDTLPAHARQVMYQARPKIQHKTGRPLSPDYFIQTLLPDYIAEWDPDWDVVFDDRGHFTEPRGGTFGLGTISVRNYLNAMHPAKFSGYTMSPPALVTVGPSGSFGNILFIEKEGFMPLFHRVKLAERFDLAIMSTKGVSVTAARLLIDSICRRYRVPLLVLRDFDKAGFSIFGTLHRDTRRYTFQNRPKPIDLGLRLDDVEQLGLDGEKSFDRGSRQARASNLRTNGATDREIAYLLDKRVELNALPSDELVAFVERKLTEHGVKKVVPSRSLLAEAYRHAVELPAIEKAMQKAFKEAKSKSAKVTVPDNLADRVAAHLKKHPEESWNQAVATIATPKPKKAKP